MKIAAKGGGFDRRSSFSTWLFRIARNAAVDELRRRGREKAIHGKDMADLPELAAPGCSPLEMLEKAELLARVRQAIDELPEAQREAFLLKEEADLDFQEIAEIVGCPRDTIKSRFRLALEKLRSRLISGFPQTGRGNNA